MAFSSRFVGKSVGRYLREEMMGGCTINSTTLPSRPGGLKTIRSMISALLLAHFFTLTTRNSDFAVTGFIIMFYYTVKSY